MIKQTTFFMALILLLIYQSAMIITRDSYIENQNELIDLQDRVITQYEVQAENFYDKVVDIGKEYAKGTKPTEICKIFSDAAKISSKNRERQD